MRRSTYKRITTIAAFCAASTIAAAQGQTGAVASKSATAQTAAVVKKSLLVQGFDELKTYDADKAIACFTPLLVHAAKKDLKQPQNRKLLAQYFALMGRTLWIDENASAAAQSFCIANALDPGNPTFELYLAEARSRTGRDKEAHPIFVKAIERAERDPIAARLAGRYLLRAESLPQARKIIESALKQKEGAKDYRLYAVLARICNRQGFQKQGLALLKRMKEMPIDDYTSALNDAAIAVMEKDPVAQQKALRKAGTILPQDPIWVANFAACMTGKEKEDLYRQAALCRRLQVRVLASMGSFYNGQKRRTEAQQVLTRMERLAPWHESTYLLRSALLNAADKPDQALANYYDLVAFQPHLASAHNQLGDALMRAKNYPTAEKVFTHCTKTLPTYITGWRRLGDSLARQDKWEQAKKAYDQALALSPKDEKQLNELGLADLSVNHSALGAYYYRKGDMKTALEHATAFNQLKFNAKLPWYLTLIAIRPGKLELKNMLPKERKCADHVMLGDMLFQHAQLKDSIKEYRLAIDLNPNEVDLHTYLLEVLTEDGDWVGAAQEDWQTSNKLIGKIPAAIKDAFGKKEDEKDKSGNEKSPEPAESNPNSSGQPAGH